MCCACSPGSSCSLKSEGKTDISCDRRVLVGYCLKKCFWLKAGNVEGDDGVAHGNPPNFEISLVAEIARMANTRRVNQDSASKGINAVMRRFPPVPIPSQCSGHVCSQLKLKHGMQIDQILRSQERHCFVCKVCAAGKKRVERPKRMPGELLSPLYTSARNNGRG